MESITTYHGPTARLSSSNNAGYRADVVSRSTEHRGAWRAVNSSIVCITDRRAIFHGTKSNASVRIATIITLKCTESTYPLSAPRLSVGTQVERISFKPPRPQSCMTAPPPFKPIFGCLLERRVSRCGLAKLIDRRVGSRSAAYRLVIPRTR